MSHLWITEIFVDSRHTWHSKAFSVKMFHVSIAKGTWPQTNQPPEMNENNLGASPFQLFLVWA